MWTTSNNRRIDLSDKESQLQELLHESNVLSSFQKQRPVIKQLISNYDDFRQNVLDLSSKVNATLATRNDYVAKLLGQQSQNEQLIRTMKSQIQVDENKLLEMQINLKSKVKDSGGFETKISDYKIELDYISKIEPGLEMKIFEYVSEMEKIDRAMAMQSSSKRSNHSISSLIERTELNIRSTKAEIAGEMTLKKALVGAGFSSNDLSVLTTVFNDDLLSVIPNGSLGRDSLKFLKGIISEYRDTENVNFDEMSLDVSGIPLVEISEQLTVAQLSTRLNELTKELNDLNQDKILIDSQEESRKRKKELTLLIENGQKNIERLKKHKDIEKDLKQCELELVELEKVISSIESEHMALRSGINARIREIQTIEAELKTVETNILAIDEKINLIDQYEFIVRNDSEKRVELHDFTNTLDKVVKSCSKLSVVPTNC